MLIGDCNVKESKPVQAQFLHNYNAVNIIHESVCYKSMNTPSGINLTTNSPNSFQNMSTFWARLSDFHKLAVAVFKSSSRKTTRKELRYRDYNKFNVDDFKTALRQNLSASGSNDENSKQAFLALLDKHVLYKSKKTKRNQVPYMTKNHRKKIMKKSQLKTFWKNIELLSFDKGANIIKVTLKLLS